MSDKETIGQRLEKVIADKRIKSRRAFALSIDADPSFFDKMVRGSATLTDNYADNIASKYGVNKEWLFSGLGAPYVDNNPKEPSTMTILDRLSQAFIDQAAAFRAQAELMKSIEANMARQSDQEKIKEKVQDAESRFAKLEKTLGEMEDKSSVASNLNFVVATVKKLSQIQDQAIEDLRGDISQILSAQNASLMGERRSVDQTDGDGHKPGRRRPRGKGK